MTTLTRWLLRAFADNWPVTGAGTYAGTANDDPAPLLQDGDPGGPLYLEDRDDSTILSVDTSTDPTTLARGRPRKAHDLKMGGVLGVALTDASATPAGLGGLEYRNEPVLSVRMQAATEYETEQGLATAEAFEDNLARVAEDIVKQDIDNGTLQAAPGGDFYNAEPQNQAPQMDQTHSAWTWQFEVQPRGYEQL